MPVDASVTTVQSNSTPKKSLLSKENDNKDSIKQLDELSFKSDSSFDNTPTKQKTSELNRFNGFGSAMLSSSSSLNSLQQKSRRFDERIRSRFSATSGLSLVANPQSVPSTARPSNKTKPIAPSLSKIKWIDLEILNNFLWSDETRLNHGQPTCIVPGTLIAIGTSRGHILVFDYKQKLIHILGVETHQSVSGAVVTLTSSLDSTHMAAGMSNGAVFVWDLSNVHKPLVHIPPLRNVSEVADGHIERSSITNLCFIGRRRTVLMSGDVHGMVILHRIHKRVLGVTCSSKRVSGHYTSLSNRKPVTILGCAALPLGSYVDATENRGLVAIMNQNALVVVSNKDGNVKTEFTTGKPQMVDTRMGNSGCLAWLPACVLKDGTRVPAKLAYCFDNVLTIVEVSGSSAGSGHSDAPLSFRSQRRWVCDELIVGIQWINNTLLGVLTHTQNFILINEKSMIPSKPLDLVTRHIFAPDLYSNMESHQTFRVNFNSTFKTYKGKFFIIGRYEVLIGSLNFWMDELLDLIATKDYVKAIEYAMIFYKGTDIDLDSVGLPLDDNIRYALILNYLKDMINASINQVLTADAHDEELHELLYISIKALASVYAGSVVFEDLYELIRLRSLENVFFECLEPFVLGGEISQLTATVLNDMIVYYNSFGKTEQLERIVCSLDISTLDIDSTLACLKKNGLIDSYIYIWNSLLKDYVTPLLELIKTSDDRSFVYLAYILTGRQYPTENMIVSESEAESAKLSIYYLLFNGTYITHDNITPHDQGASSSFPYLHRLLSQDSKAFLCAFNEILEDSLLNDDEIIHQGAEKLKVNRQFIVDILIEVLGDDSDDSLSLSIFIARSYPKFKQFIRLSESILDRTVKDLCSYTTSTKDIDPELKYDCELSLQSLLSVYQPSNKSELIEFFEKAGFYEILINLYLNDERFSKVLEVWLLQESTNSIDTTSAILEKCFRSTEKNKEERKRVVHVIENNFDLIIEADTTKVATLLNKYCPYLHQMVLKSEQVQLKYMYLSSLVELEKSGFYKLNTVERTEFIKTMSVIDPDYLVSTFKGLDEGDYNFDECVGVLRENNCVDALVYLFNQRDNFEESIQEITQHLGRLLNSMNENVKNNRIDLKDEDFEKQLWRYLQNAIDIANYELNNSNSRRNLGKGLSRDERLWLQLIDFVVRKLKEFDGEDDGVIPTKPSDIIKRLLQDLFSSLINTRTKVTHSISGSETNVNLEEAQNSFLKIFTSFVNSSTISVAYLGDIRSVTKEIYLAFTYEKHVLTITSNLLNEIIYSNFSKSMNEAIKGWSVKNFECEACGKVLWGRGIPSESFIAWGATKGLSGFEKQHDSEKYDLISFDCGHCYHLHCLGGLAGKNKNWNCILCHHSDD